MCRFSVAEIVSFVWVCVVPGWWLPSCLRCSSSGGAAVAAGLMVASGGSRAPCLSTPARVGMACGAPCSVCARAPNVHFLEPGETVDMV